MNPLSGLSVLPVVPWPLVVLLAVVADVLIWWPTGRQERAETLAARIRRSAMVLLLLVAVLRPALPGTDVRLDASSVDAYFVVDTTTSVMARDYAGGRPRIDGVRADLKGIAGQLPGARFTVLTFDLQTATRLPLTSDAAALGSAADTLRPETSTWSRGSSVTVAREALASALDRGRASHPERARLVFYFGDGEQTSQDDPEPFTLDPQLVNGGAVLGYGTSTGGRMTTTGTRGQGDVIDPSTGGPALSVIDEKQLGAIATQLGLPYVHRTEDDGGVAIVDAVRFKELAPLRASDASQVVGGRTELYWVALLLLAALAAWEVAVSAAATGALRQRSPARRRRRAAPDRASRASLTGGTRR